MAKELRPIDISNIQSTAELLHIVDELRQAHESGLIQSAGEDVAILRPLKQATSRSRRKPGVITHDDALWNIVGIADRPDDPVTDVSANKHGYLAEAYAPTQK